MDKIIYIIVSFFSTLVGSISGMGGGVIMKPVFDIIGKYTAFETSVFMALTMLAMSIVSVLSSREQFKKEKKSTRLIFIIASGSLIGGFIGDAVFTKLSQNISDTAVKTVQNCVLLLLVLLVIVYMRTKKFSFNSKNPIIGILAGICLGIISSFIGIGGGPINVAVLTLVFGFSIKLAVICSLSSVLLAQSAKTLSIILHNGFAVFNISILPFTVLAGVLGAFFGRKINKKLSDNTVNKLFCAIQIIVIVMCIVNIIRAVL